VPRDDDRLLTDPGLQWGSGVIGICDVCGTRQAVIVLNKERFKLCVLDFLNKTWTKPGLTAGAPLPPYRSERLWYPTGATPEGRAPAILLSPTKAVRRPAVLFTPDIYGLTTSILDGAIRLAREGFEVMLPDVGKTAGVGPRDHLSLRGAVRFGGGIHLDGPRVAHLRRLYADALKFLRSRELVDPEKCAVIGLSYGGSLAIALAGEDPALAAAVVAYPVPVQPADYLKLLSVPVLFVAPGSDGLSRKARAQYESLGSAVDVRFLEFPNAHHDFLARDLRAYDLPAAEAAWDGTLAFLKQRLFPPPPKPPAPLVRTTAPPPPVAASPAPTTAPPAPSSVPTPLPGAPAPS
jgi:carboxymethylenebutenolidase